MSQFTIRRRNQIAKALESKPYRDAYVAQHIKRGVAFQLRALREARGWSQSDLSSVSGKKQSFISSLENPDTGGYTLNTLQEMASAFDVALIVRFAPFSQLVDYTSNITPDDLAPPCFADDPGLGECDIPEQPGTQPRVGVDEQ